MELAAIQQKIDSITWYHEFDFPGGLKARSTHDVEGHRLIWKFIQDQLDQIDFRGKSVLDIGCWDGYWSFYAERRGAESVLASDDCTQNWLAGQGLRLAHELMESRVEIDQRRSIYDLQSLDRKFDIVLCLGVYYHLLDPYYAFSQVRHCCHENTIVVFEGDGIFSGMEPNRQIFDLSNLSASIFVPTAQSLRHMLQSCYLQVESQTWLHQTRQPQTKQPPGAFPRLFQEEKPVPEIKTTPTADTRRLGWRWRMKMLWETLKGSRQGIAEQYHVIDPPQPPPVIEEPKLDRLFTICRAFEGETPMHSYLPPFGLDQYDPRFRK